VTEIRFATLSDFNRHTADTISLKSPWIAGGLREAATSPRKHGFGEEQWELHHVGETATHRNHD
jgi:hypothetical protein